MIKITLTSAGRALSRTFYQSKIVLGSEGEVDFTLPFSLGPGEFIAIHEEEGSFLLSGAAGNYPIESGERFELGGWSFQFEGVVEGAEAPSDLDRELAELERAVEEQPDWEWEHRPRQRRWPIVVGSLLLFLIATYGLFAVQGYQEQRRAAESLAHIGAALQIAADSDEVPEGGQSRLANAFLSTQLARLIRRGVAADTASELKGEIRRAHYTLKLYTSDNPHNFLLVAKPLDDSFWRIFVRKPTLVMSSEDMVVRRTDLHRSWRDLLGWSFSLEKADPARLQALLETAKPVREAG